MLNQFRKQTVRLQSYAESWHTKDPKERKRIYWTAYSLFFGVMTVLVFWPFFKEGKSFIWIGGAADGWAQHYTALVYFGRWLRDAAEQIFLEHSFDIPTYTFSMGYGSDLFTTLHYYVIGDPLDLLAVFVPSDLTQYLYGGLILLRLYLAGLSFSVFCCYRREPKTAGLLAGSFVYVFCGFALYGAVRHPYFINPMIYLPLLLLGAEKLLQEKRPWLFIGMVFLSAVSNFYFFYMLVLFTVLYVLFRLFMLYDKKQVGQAAVMVLQMFGYAVIGVMLSAGVLLPVLYLFFGDPRSGSGYVHDLFYPRSYYARFLSSFVTFDTPGYWNFMGYSAVALLSVAVLFFGKKKNAALKCAFLLLTGFLLLPAAGRVFNGFSYVTNRWVWGYSMLVAFILVVTWEDMLALTRKQVWVAMGGAVLGVCAFLVLDSANTDNFALALILLLLALVILLLQKEAKTFLEHMGTQALLLMLVLAGIWCNAYYGYSDNGKDYADQFQESSTVTEAMHNTDSEAVKDLKDEDGFYRYSGSCIRYNSTLLSGMSSTQYFWSLSNGVIVDYLKALEVMEPFTYTYREVDGRTALHALAGVKYYVTLNKKSHERFVPYGFEEIEQENSAYRMFENQYALPLGYTYDSYLLSEDMEGLDGAGIQEALLQGVLLEEAPEGYEREVPEITGKNMEYRVSCGEGAALEDNTFTVTRKNASVTLEFTGLEQCETYLNVKGLVCQDTPEKVQIQVCGLTAEDVRVVKNLTYYTENYSWYSDRHDFMVNLCYSEDARNKIVLTFKEKGTYHFDELSIICQPMEDYAQQVTKLGQNVLENVDLHNDNRSFATSRVTGTITLEQPEILCLSIPYSAGWKAYADGEEQPLLKANMMYMALELDAGTHHIELVYETPGRKAGLLLTCLGGICLGALYLFRRKRKQAE